MKIALVGYSGSGKSRTAKHLGEMYHIKPLYMDQLHWQPGWVEQAKEVEIAQYQSYLNEHEDWIIDGNYFSLGFEQRMAQADQIIFFNFSRWNCLWRVLKRYLKHQGKTRESMTQGCEEKLDWGFLRWILLDGRSKDKRQQYEAIFLQYPDKAIQLHNQKELDAFLLHKTKENPST